MGTWVALSMPTLTSLTSIASTHASALQSSLSVASEIAATATAKATLYSASEVIRGAQASLTVISNQGYLQTATATQEFPQVTQAIFNATLNLEELAWSKNLYDASLSKTANWIFTAVFIFAFKRLDLEAAGSDSDNKSITRVDSENFYDTKQRASEEVDTSYDSPKSGGGFIATEKKTPGEPEIQSLRSSSSGSKRLSSPTDEKGGIFEDPSKEIEPQSKEVTEDINPSEVKETLPQGFTPVENTESEGVVPEPAETPKEAAEEPSTQEAEEPAAKEVTEEPAAKLVTEEPAAKEAANEPAEQLKEETVVQEAVSPEQAAQEEESDISHQTILSVVESYDDPNVMIAKEQDQPDSVVEDAKEENKDSNTSTQT
ncbi:hypothetical protein QCA50_016803 [Cerrena zonata]|uniref:Uncharacterized protein n=1 Tax=Cerrena zonata TaxID=2478898 RepID=A0AAW0FEH1_9APHY